MRHAIYRNLAAFLFGFCILLLFFLVNGVSCTIFLLKSQFILIICGLFGFKLARAPEEEEEEREEEARGPPVGRYSIGLQLAGCRLT